MKKPIELDILNNTIYLDQECWVCEGGTREPLEGWGETDSTCENCHGTGFELTHAGEAIMDLIRRHGK